MTTSDTAGTAREGMTMTEHGEHREIARLIGDLRRAERERDDLAATLETRTAEHAMAMARVAELEAIIAGRTTPPTDGGAR